MRRPAAVIVAILAIALSAVAAMSYRHPLGARMVIESDPFTVTARLPEGWTMEGGTIVLPDEVRSSCWVHREWVRDDWKKALAAIIRDSPPEWREVHKVGGHEAAEFRASTKSRTTESVYVNLEDLQPATFVVWSVEADNTDAGHQCRWDFAALVGSLAIEK